MQGVKEKQKQLNISLPESLYAAVEKNASEEYTSMGAIVRRALIQYFANKKEQ